MWFTQKSAERKVNVSHSLYRTSLFIGCSGLYCLILVVGCLVFLTSEIVTHHVPLHYFEVGQLNYILFYEVEDKLLMCFFPQGLFTYMYVVSILFLLYVFCFLLHEYSCCGGPPQGTSGRNTYFQVGPGGTRQPISLSLTYFIF